MSTTPPPPPAAHTSLAVVPLSTALQNNKTASANQTVFYILFCNDLHNNGASVIFLVIVPPHLALTLAAHTLTTRELVNMSAVPLVRSHHSTVPGEPVPPTTRLTSSVLTLQLVLDVFPLAVLLLLRVLTNITLLHACHACCSMSADAGCLVARCVCCAGW